MCNEAYYYLLFIMTQRLDIVFIVIYVSSFYKYFLPNYN